MNILKAINLNPFFNNIEDWLMDNRIVVKKDFDDIVASTLQVPLLNYLLHQVKGINLIESFPYNLLSIYYNEEDLIQDTDDLLLLFYDYLESIGYDSKKQYLLLNYTQYHSFDLVELEHEHFQSFISKLNQGLSGSGSLQFRTESPGDYFKELLAEQESARIFERAKELNIPLPFYHDEINTESSNI